MATEENDRQRAVPSVPFSEHRYALRSDSESQWRTLYRHYTNYQQQSVSQSCQSTKVKKRKTAAEAEAFCLRKSELSKLLTSSQLTPHVQVMENQQNDPLIYIIIRPRQHHLVVMKIHFVDQGTFRHLTPTATP